MPREASPDDLFAREGRARPDPDTAEKHAVEAMAEKLRREADSFLNRRPRGEEPARR